MSKPQLIATTQVKIEKGLPVPTLGTRHIKYPFKDMQVGDSFLVAPDDSETPTQLRERCSAAMSYGMRNNSNRFCSRKVEGGIRIWRIE